MAIAFIQVDNKSQSVTTTYLTNSLTYTAGNLIVLTVGANAITDTMTVSGGGNTWTQAIGPIDNVCRAYQFYAANCIGGTYQITVTKSPGVASSVVSSTVCEYSGVKLISPLDQVSSGTGTATTSFDVGTGITTTQANEILVAGIVHTGAATHTAGTNYTCRFTGNSRSSIEDRIVSATGTYTAPFTTGGAVTGSLVLGSYKAPLSNSNSTMMLMGV